MIETDKRMVLNFGGGVQSTALALLCIERHPQLVKALDGKLPHAFIFADTGDEPFAVMRHVEMMAGMIEQAGFDFHTVSAGVLSDHVTGPDQAGLSLPPLFVATRSGDTAPIRRGCTGTFKAKPIGKLLVQVYGKRPKDPVRQIFGISADEAQRMRDPDKKWLRFVYPLVIMGWKRSRCIDLNKTHGIQAPRSACYHCPFHSSLEWSRLRSDHQEWARVVAFEKAVHEKYESHGLAGLESKPFLHRSRVPIDQIGWDDQPDLFSLDDECAGLCGV